MLAERPHNLPVHPARLIGRDDEAVAVRERLLEAERGLLTLTGTGGVGKTGLALEVARGLLPEFPDGVWLIELATVDDPALVPEAVASALGVQAGPARPVPEALAAFVGERALLLVLDNCEHLVDACARLAQQLLSTCPELRVLATSREPLRVPGERLWRVPSLAAPDPGLPPAPEQLGRYPAVELFVERARAVKADFALTTQNARAVAEACARLDGIPLAIELAAARLRALGVEQVAARLGDSFRLLGGGSRTSPSRQQTLEATLDWSWDLLDEQEQALLRRLAVFAGGWTPEAAEAICAGGGIEPEEVLDLLLRLVDKSLVLVSEQAGEARYRLLEPIRQYARERLAASADGSATQERHAAFLVALAERAEPELYGPRQVAWQRRLDRELDNVRAAVRGGEERGDAQTVLRLCGALWWHLWMRGHLREGARWVEVALAWHAPSPPSVRASALCAAAMLLGALGQHPQAARRAREGLTLFRHLGDAHGTGKALTLLAHEAFRQGDVATARPLYEEAVEWARQSGSGMLIAHSLTNLGQILRHQGDLDRALALYQESLACFEAQGDSWGIAYAGNNLAVLLHEQGDHARAAELSARSVRLLWEQGDSYYLLFALEDLARALLGAGRAEAAVRLFAAVQALRASSGAVLSPGGRSDYERYVAEARAFLGDGGFAVAWSEGETLSTQQAVAAALASPDAAAPPARPAQRRPTGPLSRREREVAALLARGYTNRRIAKELTITDGTVGIHVEHILGKLGLYSRRQVADWVAAHGLPNPAYV